MKDTMNDIIKNQPIINVGVLGHVAHGKSTLVKQVTGIRTQKHSNENKTGRTIKLGYANVKLFQCKQETCKWYYTQSSSVTSLQCTQPNCDNECILVNHISFVDAPGHEFLMTTMLNGAAVMDCAILVIAANEKVPQPQTQEHLIAAEIMGLTNILIVQNKIDTVTLDKAEQNRQEIKEWVKGTCAENSPIIPISAHRGDGLQNVIESLAQLDVCETQADENPVFACIRSFDVNKPGTPIDDLTGGVIGGTLLQGTLSIGDEIYIKPGLQKTDKSFIALKTIVTGIQSENNRLEKAIPGGLIALETTLDPRFTCKDNLVGAIVGVNLPEISNQLTFKYFSLKGTKFHVGDIVKLTYLSRSVNAQIIDMPQKRTMTLTLQEPLCIINRCSKLSVSITVNRQFRLVGVGNITPNDEIKQRTFKYTFGSHLKEYSELLNQIKHICVTQTKKKTVIKIAPPECEKQGGARTVWINFGLVSEQLGKPIGHFMNFITSELGTTSSLNASKALVLYGSYTSSNFESLIRSYVKKYCKCTTCGNCETDMESSNNMDTITCKYCGMTSSLEAVKKNSKKGKGGKLNM